MLTRVFSIVLSVSVLFLLASPAWAEPKPFSGTGQATTRFNAETSAVTFTRSDSGSSNDLGQYTCTITGSVASRHIGQLWRVGTRVSSLQYQSRMHLR